MMMIFMHAVMAQSWNVLAGFSGQISLGHAIFYGIGAYATAYFYVKLHITPWIGILIGIGISGFVAMLIGIPILRLKGHYFAIATLLIGIISELRVEQSFRMWRSNEFVEAVQRR